MTLARANNMLIVTFSKVKTKTMKASSIVIILFKMKRIQYFIKTISVIVKRRYKMLWIFRNKTNCLKSWRCSRSKITIAVSEVLRIWEIIELRNMFEKSCKKIFQTFFAIFKLHIYFWLTWSVTLLFRGSPPRRSNWTRPNIKALHGKFSNPHVMPLTILSATVYSSTSMAWKL